MFPVLIRVARAWDVTAPAETNASTIPVGTLTGYEFYRDFVLFSPILSVEGNLPAAGVRTICRNM